MNPYIIEITPQAGQQMDEIAQYIKVVLHSPGASAALMRKLRKEIASLALFPARIALIDEPCGQRLEIRRLPVKNHLVYFRIDEEAHKVYIEAVVCGGRDQWQQILKMDLT